MGTGHEEASSISYDANVAISFTYKSLQTETLYFINLTKISIYDLLYTRAIQQEFYRGNL